MALLGGLLSACTSELPPRSVEQFMSDNPALQATLVRCREGGFEAERDVECANARQAAERLGALEAEAKRDQREAEFERRRQALREQEARDRAADPDQPAEEAIEPPDQPADDATAEEFQPSDDAALEAEIRRLQEELERRRQQNDGS
jgi:hypothetical protein